MKIQTSKFQTLVASMSYRLMGWVSIMLCAISSSNAAPRTPQPPWPQPTLKIFGFDSPYAKVPWRTLALNEENAVLPESWSGFALSREGFISAPVVIPVRPSEKELYLAPSHGAVRFWYAANWSTASKVSGGTGPGHKARLLELVNVAGKAQTRWSLFLNETGDTISLAGETKLGAAVMFQAPVEFTAWDWRMFTLCYSETNVTLQLDNVAIAKSKGLLAPAAWEEMDLGLVIGSDLFASADSVAEGQFEELTTFVRWPKKSDWQEFYFQGMKRSSLLGPLGTKTEEQAKVAALKATGLLPEDYGVAAKSIGEGDGGTVAYSYAAGTLWLEILGVTNAEAALTVHGTVAGQDYAILSKQYLTNTSWGFEQIVAGVSGQDWTPAFAPVAERTNELFFWAVSLGDADGDGISDFWELEQGLNPNDAADAAADPDEDGYTNWDEFLLGQDPHVADPPRPTLTISALVANAGEPNTPGIITLTRTGTTTRTLTAYFTVYGSARGGIDYQALTGQATFAVGQSTTNLTIQPVDDQNYEGAEEVTLQILPSVHYFNASNAVATVTIGDDDLPGLKVGASWDEMVEGSGTKGVFQFYRDGDTRLPLTVNFTLTGTATNGVIIQTLPTSITFAPGDSTTNLAVMPINNTNYAGRTTSLLTVLPSAAYRIETNAGNATLTLLDDDFPIVSIVATDADAREAGLNPGRFTVSRSGPTQEALTVNYRVTDIELADSNSAAADYQALSGVVTISVGQSTVNIDVNPVQDNISEPMERVLVTLAGGQAYRIGNSNSATVNIDDDEPVAYSVTVKLPSVYGAHQMPGVIEIIRRGSALAAASVSYAVTDLNGNPIGNHQITGDLLNGNVYFAPNQFRAQVNLLHTLATLTNLQFRFASTLNNVPCWGNNRLLYLLTTTDTAYEGDSVNKARFSIQRASGGPALAVPLRFSGSATPGVDFPLTNLAPVNFPANSSSVTVEVFANADAMPEGWESLIVRLDPTNLNFAFFNPGIPGNTPPLEHETSATLWLRENSNPGLRPPVDSDEDQINDSYEIAHGTHPLIPDDANADADRDGLSLLEESLVGTESGLKDSDNDALDDYVEWTFGSNPTNAAQHTLQAASEYVAVKLSAASCFWCHQTTLNVGSYQLRSAPPIRSAPLEHSRQEKVFELAKGFSYPVTISGSITSSTGTYTAQIEAAASGVLPEFFLNDPNGMLGVGRPASALPGKVATLIVPKVELTWANKGDNFALDMNTNGFNGEVRGNRIFVGAKTPTENLPRNTVLLKIKTTPPLAGSNVWLRSFDVDDTTDDKGFDNTGVIDTTGRAGGDNYVYQIFPPQYGIPGLFAGNNSGDYTATLNAQGEALVEFRVSLQPGDNYRIAATVFPTNNLNTLQSATPTDDGYVSAYTDWIRGDFNGSLSPLLTVWRKLHLEIDSMTNAPTSGPQANFKTAKIEFVQPNAPNAGQSVVFLQYNGIKYQPQEQENGSLTISGMAQPYAITANEPLIMQTIMGPGYNMQIFQNRLIVQGLVPTNTANASVELRDDDDRLKAELQLPNLPLDGFSHQIIEGKDLVHSPGTKMRGVAAVYRPAFIEAVDANAEGWNIRPTIPFYLNQDVFYPFSMAGVFDDAKDLADAQVFWAHTLTFGYQPSLLEDADPNTELPVYGTTPETPFSWTSHGYSAVYEEAVRERAWMSRQPQTFSQGFYNDLESEYYGWLFGTVAHEVGHAPGKRSEGDDHDEGDLRLMQKGAANILAEFAPKTIGRFRSSSSWTGGAP